MTLVAELRCGACGHPSNAPVDRLFPLGSHRCPECGGRRQVISVFRDRRVRDVPVDEDRRSGDQTPDRLDETA